MLLRVVGCLFLLAGCVHSQTPFPMTEIAELRDLYWDMDSAGSTAPVELGLARLIFESRDVFRVEGVDDQGRPWQAWIPHSSGPHLVYRADFDKNGRDDLLFATAYASNGRCVEGGVLTSFLFDEAGRPIPWSKPSQGMLRETPVTLLDLNRDGRAELVTSDCEYAAEMREKRWLNGVYEARDARWQPLPAEQSAPYLEAAQQPYFDYDWADWSEPATPWEDPLEGWEQVPPVELTGILGGEIGCPTYDDPESDCEPGSGFTRLRFSDGSIRALRFGHDGWPAVVADGPAGRFMFLAEPYRWQAVQRVFNRPLQVLGAPDAPAVLWLKADLDMSAEAPELTSRTILNVLQTEPVSLIQGNPPPGPPPLHFDSGAFAIPAQRITPTRARQTPPPPTTTPQTRPSGSYFSRDGRCFHQGDRWQSATVYELPSCELLRDFQPAAEQGRIVSDPAEGSGLVLDADSAALTRGGRTVRLSPPTDLPGRTVGAVELESGAWLAQWSYGAEQYLVQHRPDGVASSEASRIDVAGELLESDRRGLVFVHWVADQPAEIIRARATIEWSPVE